jgi:hypothetical protein
LASRLREELDEPGAWTRIKIVVAGTKASLYVNGADQPCLIVNDLKLGETHDQFVVWIVNLLRSDYADNSIGT